MKLYKLTDENDRDYSGFQWGEGIEYIADIEGGIYWNNVVSGYTHPLLAVFLNHIPKKYSTHLWECDGDVTIADHGLKVGCTRFKTIRRIPLPQITSTQKARFAILCGLEVCRYDKVWINWAKNWLNGTDQSKQSTLAMLKMIKEEKLLPTILAIEDAVSDATWTVAAVTIWMTEEMPVWKGGGPMTVQAVVAENAARIARLDLIALAKKATEEK